MGVKFLKGKIKRILSFKMHTSANEIVKILYLVKKCFFIHNFVV